MPNGFLTTENILDTDTQLLGYPEQVYYSGASGVNVDNTNLIISLTGEVGKVYNGVNPIIVNNEENLISANSAPIGVQEPLYFVQDDDEAVVIGLSGEYVSPSDITGKLDTSSFESWQQGQYTNDLTAINEKINEVSSNIPSIEGLATEQLVEETSANIVSQIPSTAGLASETYVQEQTSAKASKSDLETVSGDIVNLIPDVSNYYTKDETSGAEQLAEAFSQIGPGGDEEVNELVHSNSAAWNEVSSKLDESTFQEASGLFLTAIPQEYITESDIPNFISAKLDTSSFADVSGSFLTAHQSLEGYATEQFVEDTSASITALIPTDYYPNSNPSGFITGVDLSNYYQKNETSSKEEISAAIAAIPLGDEEVNELVHTNSATWNTVTDKLDTTAFSDVSGSFLTAHQSLDGYATETLVEETSGAITSLIPTDYYPDTNPSGFISGVDLTPYQTIEGMTAYQPVGDYATTSELEQVSADITATIPSTAGLASESYVQTNSAVLTAMIAEKQDTLTFGYDEQDRINSINNSALAGGGDVPEDVMVETGLGYNAVGEISAYGNSAIAQYGAEKQWLQHDDTIVHISNSAQYAFGCNISALQRLMGIDETVLWEGSKGVEGDTMDLSEPVSAFNKIKFEIDELNPQISTHSFVENTNGTTLLYPYFLRTNSNKAEFCGMWTLTRSNNDTRLTVSVSVLRTNGTTSGFNAAKIIKAVGVGRKEV